MARIGIFFGTDSGSTRLVAKKIAKQIKERLGDGVAARLDEVLPLLLAADTGSAEPAETLAAAG